MATSESRTRKKKTSADPGPAAEPVAGAGAGTPESAPAAAPKRARARKAAPGGAAPRRKAPVRRASKPAAGSARAKTPRAAAEGGPAPAAGDGRALVIVESPTKSRTITKFLGRGFTVLASNGHIMDLPKRELGVDLDNDFEPTYVPLPSKAKALGKIRAAARDATRIYLAPDPDREGEAIAWHLAGALRGTGRPVERLTFNEITQRAVRQALEQPRAIDTHLVDAQQARRVLDRLVGYKVSPGLWRRFYFGLSAGRVQSVALRMVCEREEEIRAFQPQEYWTLEADFELADGREGAPARFTARLVRIGEEELEQGQLRGEGAGERARALADELAGVPATVGSVETQPRQVHPRPPFITSTLQQTAYNRLGFTAQRTMKIAQGLYEAGLITYMRTDSPRLAGEAIAEMREWLGRSLGPEYVPESPRQFRGKKAAQEAHEAIRPSAVERTPDSLRGELTEEQRRLYELIWTRAVASQCASAEYLATTAEILSGRLGLRATGRVLRFAGFQRLYGVDEEDEENGSSLPELASGAPLAVAREAVDAGTAEAPKPPVRPEQHFTQPPPRYTEASLVRALEEQDVGRPSTYATIVGTITSREYVERDKGRLVPTALGMAVNRSLVEGFPDIFMVDFTSRMEDELDEVEEGRRDWRAVVREFWTPFSQDLKKWEKGKSAGGEPTDKICPVSGHPLRLRFNRRGAYLACSGYPKCKYTEPLEPPEPPVPIEGTCPKCGAGLVARTGPFGRYVSCERRPECDFTKPFTLGIRCPKCGEGELAEKRSKRGKVFYGCSNYPKCDYAVWDRPVPVPCPSCGAAFLLEKVNRQGRTLRCATPGCGYRSAPEPVGA